MFTPEVGEHIRLFGKDYFLQQRHGTARETPYILQGRRARVYQVTDSQGGLWALKVFMTRYRDSRLLCSTERLQELKPQRGLDAADRRVVEPSDPIVSKYPDLEYALLMPWLDGTTWSDLLATAGSQNLHWPLDRAGPLCMRFLNIMRMLESRGCAHTDIASGSVMVSYANNLDVQLIALEDMYLPGMPVSHYPNTGMEGYGHPSHASCFCPEGDRFASAILAAEILILSNPALARRAHPDGYFQGDDREARFNAAHSWLRAVTPHFAEQFDRAWNADTLRNCPTLSTLADSLRRDGIVDHEDTNLLPPDPNGRSFSRAVDPPIHTLAKSARLYRFAEAQESNLKEGSNGAPLFPAARSFRPALDSPNQGRMDSPDPAREGYLDPQQNPASRADRVIKPGKRPTRPYVAIGLSAIILMLAGCFVWFKATHKSIRTDVLATVSTTPAAEPFRRGTGADAVTLRHYGIAILAETRPFVFSSAQTGGKTTWPPEERARRLAIRLNDNLGDVTGLIAQGVSVDDAVKNVLVGKLNGAYIIYFKYGKAEGDKMGDVIFTVDNATARDCHSDAETLAYWWRDLLRNHLLITLGQAPTYPLDSDGHPHPPGSLVDLHYRLREADGDRPPDEAAFHKVEVDLLNHNLNDELENLYRNVPADFHPLRDPDTKLNLRQEDAVESDQ